MVNSTLKTRSGVVILNNRGFKISPDYTVPSRFQVSVGTSDVSWTDTSLSGKVVISGTSYYKDVDSVVFDESDGSVTVTSKLSVTEANGNLIDGHALFNTDSSVLMSDKSKFPSSSKGSSDLFKIVVKRKIRNID